MEKVRQVFAEQFIQVNVLEDDEQNVLYDIEIADHDHLCLTGSEMLGLQKILKRIKVL